MQQTRDMFLYVADQFETNKPFLTEIDSAIGDGDHGIGMSVGFANAGKIVKEKEFQTVNEMFHQIGMAMIGSMGGASGVIFGTMFMGGAKNAAPFAAFDLEAVTHLFGGSLQAIKDRGKAQLGDKTMVDALEPAIASLQESLRQSKTLLDGLREAEASAKAGMEKTKEYIAKFGRAKSLGERALGHQDAGATSVWIIFKSMREWVEGIHE
jgi:dihydroxyacetone kinase-like protein